jgi:uncharacterized protein involved in outer membrane biogenesis
MLPFLEELLEKKLSELLGADVSFDRVKLSPLSGKLEVINLSAKARGESEPFLSVPRIEAKIAMARALKQEISIQSLRIERPMVRLPLPITPKRRESTQPTTDRPEISKAWQFEADDVLVVDALVHFDGAGYRAIAENTTISLKRDESGIAITLMAQTLGRVEPNVVLGAAKLNGHIATRDFTKLATSPVTLAGEIADKIRVQAKTDSIASRMVDARIEGTLDSAHLSRLVEQPGSRLPTVVGDVHLDIDGTFSPSKITLRRAEISTENASIELDL